MSVRNLSGHALSILVLVAGTGCSAPPREPEAGLLSNTAVVRINDRDSGQRHYVRCRKLQWLLTIESVGRDDGFTAIAHQGADLDVQVVKLRNLNGFTGSAWRDGVGQLEAHRDSRTIVITGTAYGRFAERSRGPATAAFAIEANC